MERNRFTLDGRSVLLYRCNAPQILFLQPVDSHDTALLERQLDAMRDCALPFALAAFSIADWNRELSPWEAPPVFGREPFGGGAEETLRFLTDRLLPALFTRLSLPECTPLCLGGYSLAGLFALWTATRTDRFSGIAAASPSVWFPGWLDYAKAQPLRASRVYLSLGDREERARNPVMATVGASIREQYELLRPDHIVTLEWNPGNHFQDSEKRSARAFCWIAAQEARPPACASGSESPEFDS